MANRHFGKLADVWRHLVLAEVLSVDRPRQFCDSHAGHACYAMTADAERRYGVLGFMEAAVDDVVLNRSAYFRLLVGQGGGVAEMSDYPAGPMLAMLELGAGCEYLFCDLDPASCANTREVALRLGLGSMVRVVEGDGMTAVREAVGDTARGTLVYTDPFEHRAALPGGLSALCLAQEVAERGAAVVYWYGYNRADQRRWIFDLLRANAPTIGWWCGDLMVSAANADMRNGDLGAATSPGTGFGPRLRRRVERSASTLLRPRPGVEQCLPRPSPPRGQRRQPRLSHRRLTCARTPGQCTQRCVKLHFVADWHPPCYQRATAYVTDPHGRLLVFDHVDVPASGTQVPAGGIHDGETADEAVMRELAEESGIESASIIRKLGETWYMAEVGNVPAGREEQIQHAFHLCLDVPPAEVWEWDEKSGGDIVEHRFAFRWVSLDDAGALLWPVQAMWVNVLRLSLLNR